MSERADTVLGKSTVDADISLSVVVFSVYLGHTSSIIANNI